MLQRKWNHRFKDCVSYTNNPACAASLLSSLEMLPCSQVILTNETEDTAQPYRELHAPDFDLTAADVDTATLSS